MLYRFGAITDGDKSFVDVLGGKGAHLAEMASLGLPVPSGITIPTSYCNEYLSYSDYPEKQHKYLRPLVASVMMHLENVLQADGKDLSTCLFSVRSGAPVSMPGMMDTVLNVGITRSNIAVYAESLGLRAAWDCYRRFLQMFGSVVCSVDSEQLETVLGIVKTEYQCSIDSDLPVKALQEICEAYESMINLSGNNVPETITDTLRACIAAVFNSWNGSRAKTYRDHYNISHTMGTAVNIQLMVFGNKDSNSGSGVVFTRCPNTGANKIVGEFLPIAQGEDVVSGVRTPMPIMKVDGLSSMEALWPDITEQLLSYCKQLEQHYQDVQDIEFTVESNKLYILQTRSAKRTAEAKITLAIALSLAYALPLTDYLDLADVDSGSINVIAAESTANQVPFKGLPVGGGAIVGFVCNTSEEAVARAAKGDPVILVRNETMPEDIDGLIACSGVVTRIGGVTSHAAVVCRGLNKPCVVGCTDLPELKNGQPLTICGSTGVVYLGSYPTERSGMSGIVLNYLSDEGFIPSDIVVAGYVEENKPIAINCKRVAHYSIVEDVNTLIQQTMDPIWLVNCDSSGVNDSTQSFDLELVNQMFGTPHQKSLVLIDELRGDSDDFTDLLKTLALNLTKDEQDRIYVAGSANKEVVKHTKFRVPVEVNNLHDYITMPLATLNKDVLNTLVGGPNPKDVLNSLVKKDGFTVPKVVDPMLLITQFFNGDL